MNTKKYNTKQLAKMQEQERIRKMLTRLNKDVELQTIINMERDFEFAMEEIWTTLSKKKQRI